MRVFIIVALLAMAATVSCVDVSPACNSTSNALDVASVNAAENGIVKTGCTKPSFDIGSNQCSFDNTTSIYTCNCATVLTNTTGWEDAVRNISNGKPCYLDLTFTLQGTLKANNQTRSVVFNSTHKNSETIAVGGNCTETDISNVFTKASAEGVAQLDGSLNSDSSTTGVTWTTGTVTVSGCGIQKVSATTNIPQSTGTTPPPTGTTSPPTGATSPPTGATTPPPKNGANIIASSVVLVASSLIAAVTIAA